MSNQFWRGKKVFITGHTGFKGSWLTLWLNRMGAELSGYSLPPPSEPNMFELTHLKSAIHSTIGDVRDQKALTDAMIKAQPDIVFHMAAQPLVRESYRSPVDTFSTNVMGTVNLLEAVRAVPDIRSVVVITSDKCYENREWLWGYREDNPMGGHDPYSASKGAAELVTASYRRSFFNGNGDNQTAVATTRAGNVVGGGDFAPDRLVPDIIRALIRRESVTIRNPNAVRPWQFVLEPLRGYLTIAELLYESGQDYAEGWNFGPTETDAQTVAQICATLGHSLQLYDVGTVEINLEKTTPPLHEAAMLRLDISKARQRLDWIPKMELYTALELTADWYATYLRQGDLRARSEAQIEFFQKLT
ncbi:CDP-glucose 4,6-dehydratase [Oxalobacteraceae bacterium CAVE-383]|nr:CDP-glucose 4,6-dehydratase [Oxalobacteraceae bacterium CAVE-383]